MRFYRTFEPRTFSTTMDQVVHNVVEEAGNRSSDQIDALRAQVRELTQLVAFLAAEAKPSIQRVIATANGYREVEE